MNIKTTRKQHIVNPQNWINKFVAHTSNWRDFQWGDNGYVVCEWSKKLIKVEDAAYYGDYFETKTDAEAAGYDDCYYYSEAGLMDMRKRSTASIAA